MRRPRAAWLALASLGFVASIAAADAPSAALLVETWDADTSAAWDATVTCGSPANVVAAGAWRSSSPPAEPSCTRLARRLAGADLASVVLETRVRHAGPGVSIAGSTMVGLADAQAPARGVWIDVQSHASDTEVYLVDATGWHNLGGDAHVGATYALRLELAPDGSASATVRRADGSLVGSGSGRGPPLAPIAAADVRTELFPGVTGVVECVHVVPAQARALAALRC